MALAELPYPSMAAAQRATGVYLIRQNGGKLIVECLPGLSKDFLIKNSGYQYTIIVEVLF
jgi:hypothetical protein